MMPKKDQYHSLDKHERAEMRKEVVRRLRKGESSAALADECGVARQTVHNWMRTYQEKGLKGLSHHPRGPACALDDAQLRQLARVLRGKATRQGFPDEQWTLSHVTEYVADEFGVEYAPRSLSHVIKKLNVNPFEQREPKGRRRR